MQYRRWRDKFLANAGRAFEPAGAARGRLERKDARLKAHPGVRRDARRGEPSARQEAATVEVSIFRAFTSYNPDTQGFCEP